MDEVEFELSLCSSENIQLTLNLNDQKFRANLSRQLFVPLEVTPTATRTVSNANNPNQALKSIFADGKTQGPTRQTRVNKRIRRGIGIRPQDHHVLEQLANPNLFQTEHKKYDSLCCAKLVILKIKLKLL